MVCLAHWAGALGESPPSDDVEPAKLLSKALAPEVCGLDPTERRNDGEDGASAASGGEDPTGSPFLQRISGSAELDSVELTDTLLRTMSERWSTTVSSRAANTMMFWSTEWFTAVHTLWAKHLVWLANTVKAADSSSEALFQLTTVTLEVVVRWYISWFATPEHRPIKLAIVTRPEVLARVHDAFEAALLKPAPADKVNTDARSPGAARLASEVLNLFRSWLEVPPQLNSVGSSPALMPDQELRRVVAGCALSKCSDSDTGMPVPTSPSESPSLSFEGPSITPPKRKFGKNRAIGLADVVRSEAAPSPWSDEAQSTENLEDMAAAAALRASLYRRVCDSVLAVFGSSWAILPQDEVTALRSDGLTVLELLGMHHLDSVGFGGAVKLLKTLTAALAAATVQHRDKSWSDHDNSCGGSNNDGDGGGGPIHLMESIYGAWLRIFTTPGIDCAAEALKTQVTEAIRIIVAAPVLHQSWGLLFDDLAREVRDWIVCSRAASPAAYSPTSNPKRDRHRPIPPGAKVDSLSLANEHLERGRVHEMFCSGWKESSGSSLSSLHLLENVLSAISGLVPDRLPPACFAVVARQLLALFTLLEPEASSKLSLPVLWDGVLRWACAAHTLGPAYAEGRYYCCMLGCNAFLRPEATDEVEGLAVSFVAMAEAELRSENPDTTHAILRCSTKLLSGRVLSDGLLHELVCGIRTTLGRGTFDEQRSGASHVWSAGAMFSPGPPRLNAIKLLCGLVNASAGARTTLRRDIFAAFKVILIDETDTSVRMHALCGLFHLGIADASYSAPCTETLLAFVRFGDPEVARLAIELLGSVAACTIASSNLLADRVVRVLSRAICHTLITTTETSGPKSTLLRPLILCMLEWSLSTSSHNVVSTDLSAEASRWSLTAATAVARGISDGNIGAVTAIARAEIATLSVYTCTAADKEDPSSYCCDEIEAISVLPELISAAALQHGPRKRRSWSISSNIVQPLKEKARERASSMRRGSALKRPSMSNPEHGDAAEFESNAAHVAIAAEFFIEHMHPGVRALGCMDSARKMGKSIAAQGKAEAMRSCYANEGRLFSPFTSPSGKFSVVIRSLAGTWLLESGASDYVLCVKSSDEIQTESTREAETPVSETSAGFAAQPPLCENAEGIFNDVNECTDEASRDGSLLHEAMITEEDSSQDRTESPTPAEGLVPSSLQSPDAVWSYGSGDEYDRYSKQDEDRCTAADRAKLPKSTISSQDNGALTRQEMYSLLKSHSFLREAELLLPLPASERVARSIRGLDRSGVPNDRHKVGVAYVGPGQRGREEVLGNLRGSQAFERFVDRLGKDYVIPRAEEPEADSGVYSGGLGAAFAGSRVPWSASQTIELAFHVASRIVLANTANVEDGVPLAQGSGSECAMEHETTNAQLTSAVADKKKLTDRRWRHLGNDAVHVVWCEGGYQFSADQLGSEVCEACIVIYPEDARNHRVRILHKPRPRGAAPRLAYGPLFDDAIVGEDELPLLVRLTAVGLSRSIRELQTGYEPFFVTRSRMLAAVAVAEDASRIRDRLLSASP